jgi:ribonuclease D
MNDKVLMINSASRLVVALDAIAAQEEVGLDTEADSLYHYYEKVCLIQLCAADKVFIIDPLADFELAPLLEVLASKFLIIHGANYDLRQLKKNYNFVPERIFDTLAAAQLLGIKDLSLKSLVEKYFGVLLSKNAQKLNWSERPLKETMIHYAGNDVRYLPALKQYLSRELQELNRLSWLEEFCERIIESALANKPTNHPDKEWRIKGASSLTGQALAFAKALWYWRESEAQKANRPTFKVLSNQTLLEVALLASLYSQDEIFSKIDLPRDFVGRKLSSFKETLEEVRKLSPPQWPGDKFLAKAKPFRYIEGELLRQFTELRDKKAFELGIDPALLASRVILEELSDGQPNALEDLSAEGKLMNWQVEVLGEDISRILKNF